MICWVATTVPEGPVGLVFSITVGSTRPPSNCSRPKAEVASVPATFSVLPAPTTTTPSVMVMLLADLKLAERTLEVDDAGASGGADHGVGGVDDAAAVDVEVAGAGSRPRPACR